MPGIGKKTALRLVLHLIREKEESTFSLTDALNSLRLKIQFCKKCHNISDADVCGICISHRRDHGLICVVEDTRDVMAIENTAQFNGLYHVLGGVISPINGIGPADIKIDSLVNRITQGQQEIKEIILALSPTMEGDTTSFYINKRIKDLPVKVSVISRGISIGGDLEFTDEITLGRSITARTTFN